MATIQDALGVLQHKFGYDAFRLEQQRAIQHILGGGDCLILMPTGGGKSLCYQIPALLFEGLTVVVSPLISLMKDQVDALRANGISAAYLNSSLSLGEQNSVMRDAASGKLKLLYVAPERLIQQGDGFLSFLRDINVSLFAIDEAHCISSWGHDFRPEYMQLARLKQVFPKVPVVALTATADKLVRKDILEKLSLKEPAVFLSSFNRANIRYDVEPKKNFYPRLVEYLRDRPDQCGIIYCLSRNGTEMLAKDLAEDGFSARAYHAGMERNLREKTQELFIRDEVKIVVATIAFGMGIDKPNVRFVVHADLPKNLEGYYQETGRAGRDGLSSEAMLYFSMADAIKMKNFVLIADNPEQTKVLTRKLDQMARYGQLTTCRRKYLLNYFDEQAPDYCGNCDICLSKFDMIDGTVIAQKALSAVSRLGQSFGVNYTIDFLRGSQSEKIRGEHKEMKTYGVGADISREDWQMYMRDLIARGYLMQTEDEFPKLRLTDKSDDVLKGRTTVQLIKTKTVQAAPATPKASAEANYERDLYERLKTLRKTIADSSNVPAYVILGDATLVEMAAYLPQTLDQLRRISGFGDVKLDRYGGHFLDVIRSYTAERKLSGRIHHKPQKRERKASKPVSQSDGGKRRTSDVTYELYRQGLSLQEIAVQRALSLTTIETHLAQHIESGELRVEELVPAHKIDLLLPLIEQHGYLSLRNIKEAAGEDISYGDIRMVVSAVMAGQV